MRRALLCEVIAAEHGVAAIVHVGSTVALHHSHSRRTCTTQMEAQAGILSTGDVLCVRLLPLRAGVFAVKMRAPRHGDNFGHALVDCHLQGEIPQRCTELHVMAAWQCCHREELHDRTAGGVPRVLRCEACAWAKQLRNGTRPPVLMWWPEAHRSGARRQGHGTHI